MLSFNFNWERLSVSAGLTLRNFYFRLYPGAIGQVEVIDFPKRCCVIDKPSDRLGGCRPTAAVWYGSSSKTDAHAGG